MIFVLNDGERPAVYRHAGWLRRARQSGDRVLVYRLDEEASVQLTNTRDNDELESRARAL